MTAPDDQGALTRSTVSGLTWTYGATVFTTLVQLGYTAVMGRLLEPADFGLIAMAGVFLRFGTYFAEMGTGQAVIQRPTLTPDATRTAFTSSILLGVAFAAVIALGAPLARLFFDDPEVVPLIRVLALTLVLNGAGITAKGLLRRDLRFRAVAAVEGGSYAFGYMLVGVTAALLGAGVWSLVAAAVAQSALLFVIAYALAPHPVAPRLGGRELVDLYSFGGRVSVIGFVEFLGENLDTFAIGALAGPAPLGQYNRALLLVNLPLYRISTGLETVLFPAFSRAADQRERLARGYLVSTAVAAAALIPLGTGIAVAAPQIVAVLLGPQWTQAAAVVPVVALAAVANTVALFAALVAEASATLNRKLALVLTHVTVLGGLLALGAGRGLRVYAAAVAAAALLRLALYLLLMRRILALRLTTQLALFVPALLAAAGVGLAVAGATAAAARLGAGLLPTFAAQVCAGAAALALLATVGPLAPLRREVQDTLTRAGVRPLRVRG